jgi:Glycosyltransferase 61
MCLASPSSPGVRDPQAEWDLRFGRVRSYLAARPMACRLPGGIVETTEFMVCPDEHRYLVGSFCSRRLVSERAGFSEIEGGVFVREVEEIVERDERVVVLGSQNNVNYSHWLLENAARALLFRPLDDGTWHYLVPRLKYPFQRESLELAGIDPERILEVKPGILTRFREVAAVTRGFDVAEVAKLVPAAIAELASLAPQPDGGNRRLYVSRARAGRRAVSNELELTELVVSHGFEVVQPEMLPLHEQVELFAGAEVVAGPHGAGLTSVLFSPPGTLLIELQPERMGPPGTLEAALTDYPWSLCGLRGQRLVQVVCRCAAESEHHKAMEGNITVDLPHLDQLLSEALARMA